MVVLMVIVMVVVMVVLMVEVMVVVMVVGMVVCIVVGMVVIVAQCSLVMVQTNPFPAVGHQEGGGGDEAVLCVHQPQLPPPLDRVGTPVGPPLAHHGPHHGTFYGPPIPVLCSNCPTRQLKQINISR